MARIGVSDFINAAVQAADFGTPLTDQTAGLGQS